MRIWSKYFLAQASHVPGGFEDGSVTASLCTSRHCAMHCRAKRASLACSGLTNRPTGHIGVDLHQQLIALRQPARGHDLLNRYTIGLKIIDDDARTVRGGLNQSPVDLLWPGCQRHTEQHAGQVSVHQDRAVAIPPVQRQQTTLSRL